MKEFVRDFAPLWTVGFVGGAALGAMIFIWAYITI